MAGRVTEYPGSTNANSLKYFGLPIVTAGLVNPPAKDGYEVISKAGGSIYKKVVLKEGRIVGMVFMRDIERSGVVFGLMRERVDVGAFKDALLADNFGLSYLPDKMRQDRLKTLR